MERVREGHTENTVEQNKVAKFRRGITLIAWFVIILVEAAGQLIYA